MAKVSRLPSIETRDGQPRRFLEHIPKISRRFPEDFVKILWKFLGEKVISDILASSAFRKYSTCWVFFILCFCLCLCLWHLGEIVIFDILASPAFRKYSTCWVFFILCLCLCLRLCVFLQKSYLKRFLFHCIVGIFKWLSIHNISGHTCF